MSKGKKLKREPGRCIFCGGTGMSKEHIFSDWLKDVLPAVEKHKQQIIHTSFDLPRQEAFIQPYELERYQGGAGQRKVRRVCRRCNGEWMSEIVDLAKPFAEPLVKGERIVLDGRAQEKLSAWIALTTVVARFTDTATICIPQADRETIRDTKAPPHEWTVCIGRYSGNRWVPIRYSHRAGQSVQWSGPEVGSPRGLAQTTTYTIGSLLVHVFTSTDEQAVDYYRAQHGPRTMVPVWPPDPLPVDSYNHMRTLGDDETDRIADIFFDLNPCAEERSG